MTLGLTRNRRIYLAVLAGGRQIDLAAQHDVSPSRVHEVMRLERQRDRRLLKGLVWRIAVLQDSWREDRDRWKS